MRKITTAALITGALVSTLSLSACETDADVSSRNISVAAENFEIQRRIVAINGITDTYLFEIEGRCSWERADNFFQATCKHGPNDFKRHDFVLSDNVTVLSEQLKGVDVDEYRTRIVLKPETIIPEFDVESSVEDSRAGN